MAGKYQKQEIFTRSSANNSHSKNTEIKDRERMSQFPVAELSEAYLLQQFAQHTPDLLFIIDHKLSNILYINPAAATNLSLNPAQQALVKENFISFFQEEDWLKLQAILSGPYPQQGEMEVRLYDGKRKLRYYNLRFKPHKISTESPVAWLCQARDITESKLYLKEVQDSKLKLQMALDGSNMGVWSYDPVSQKVECDHRTCKLFGLRPGELNGDLSQLFLRIHPEDRPRAILTAINTLKRHGRFSHEFRVLLPDTAAIRHIAVVGEFVLGDQRGEAKITGVSLDISLGKIVDNKIKTNETFLEESQKIAKIGSFDWDLNTGKIHITKQLSKILAFRSEEEINLEKFYERVNPADREQVKASLKSTIKDGNPFNQEFRFSPPNGTEKVLWAQGQATKSLTGKQNRIIGAIQDISEKKEKEKEINTQSLIIKSMLDNLPVVILIVDKYGIVKSLLGSGLSRIGLDPNQTVGQSIFEQYPAIGKYIRRVLQGETVSFTEEIDLEHESLHFLSYYFYDRDRELAIGFSIDITTQKQTEQAYQQVSAKNLELERMNQLMDMFVYAVAHDLKNPVNNLEMISNLLKEATNEKEKTDFMYALHKSVHRLKQTISGLTEVIEIESSRALSSRFLHFKELTNSLLEDFNSLLKGKNALVTTEFKQARIRYNEAFLNSILKNLLSNAIKYSSSKRKLEITIKTEKIEGYIALSVQDNGIGIDLKQHSEKLFKPFKRLSRQAEGTGVGLHLIKSMVEKNGGYIEVKSTPNKGAIFTCYLIPYRD